MKKFTNSIERDENFVPSTRSELKLPEEAKATSQDYKEILEEAPLFVLARILFMQLLGWQTYILFNVMGSRAYPKGTNVSSLLCEMSHNHAEHLVAPFSNIASISTERPSPDYYIRHWSLLYDSSTHTMVTHVWFTSRCEVLSHSLPCEFSQLMLLINAFELSTLWKITNHWIVMLTYLQHSDPTIPHYRSGEWNWLRGALATVDRPLLGWVGRFFLHNVGNSLPLL